MLINHEAEFINALKKDLHKPKYEAYSADIGGVLLCIKNVLAKIDDWTKEVHIKRQDNFTVGCPTTVKYVPYGVTFVIGTWNFPINLTLTPLVLAIAAGNACIVKPSEVTKSCSEVMTRLGNRYLSQLGGVVFKEGDKNLVQSLMNENRLDFVFYTGGSVGGKAVAKLCAEKLVPSVLELGGKNPCLIDDLSCQEITVNDIARRILWSKVANSGQICLAVDYCIFKSISDRDTILNEMKSIIKKEWYPNGVDSKEPDYCHLVSKQHFQHVERFLSRLNEGESCVKIIDAEPDIDSLFYPVSAILMEDPDRVGEVEVFGSNFGCVVIEDFEQAIKFIAKRESALSAYIFTKDSRKVDRFLDGTKSGGVTVNDCMKHALNDTLPFGGVGASGWGSYHGRYGFEAFSHRRAVMRQKTPRQGVALLEPPYTAWKEQFVRLSFVFTLARLWRLIKLLLFDRNKLARDDEDERTDVESADLLNKRE